MSKSKVIVSFKQKEDKKLLQVTNF